MSKPAKIFALILLYFLACGKSCDNGERTESYREKQQVNKQTDSLRALFVSDSLSAGMLQAYEETARMKLSELRDFVIIFQDTSVAEPFRAKAGELARGLFPPGYTLEWLNEPGVTPFRTMIPESVKVTEGLKKACDTVYTGRLGFSFTGPVNGRENDDGEKTCTGTIAMVVMKQNKVFGADTLKIWNVFLVHDFLSGGIKSLESANSIK